MANKKVNLDAATVQVIKQVLAMPPKRHDEMKLGRTTKPKGRRPKARAASAKPRTA
jgi:hypothetical protein